MNWDPIILAALPATIAAIAAWLQARATHRAVNSRMDELLAMAKKEASAQATLDEKAAEQQRKGDAAIDRAKEKTMNKVVQDGVELHNVTVVITNGRAVVTKNKGPTVQPQGGGGPGEEDPGGGGGP